MKKTKFNIKKTSRASVSVMLSFLMLPVYTFAGAVTDGVKVSSARRIVSSAADLTAEAGLSDYDEVLRSVYGLFAVSSDEEELQKNLSDYFYRTVNNTAFTEEDSSGRRYIDGIADFFSDPEGVDFDNLIKLNTESFQAEFNESAVLADPVVLKSQIDEYMKYTGPLAMSKGILNKLDAFSDFKAQNHAIDTKINYDKSLEKINALCCEIWKNASAYNRLLSENKLSSYSDMASDIQKINNLYTDGITLLLMYRSLKDADLSLHDRNKVYENACEYSDDNNISLKDALSAMTDYYTENEFIQKLSETASEENDFVFVKNVSDISDELSYACAVINLWNEECEKFSDPEKNNNKEKNDKLMDQSLFIENIFDSAVSVRDSWKQNADMKFREASDTVCGMCEGSDEAIGYLENILYCTDDLLERINEAEKSGRKWQEAIDELADGDIKSSMQSEYDSGVKALNKTDISHFRDVTEKNLDHFRAKREQAESVKFYGRRICEHFDYSDVYLSLLSHREINCSGDAESAACQETAENLNFPGDIKALPESAQSYDHPFYSYLSSVYGKNAAAPADKGSAKELIKAMNSLGDPASLKPEVPESARTDIRKYISDDKLEKIKKYGQADAADESFETEISDDSAGSTLESQQAVLQSTGTFLESIGELGSAAAGEGIEDLLVAEYIMQMFSCYTSDKEYSGGKVKTVVPCMMSGVELCADNNVFYGSEAEYILWGNEDMEKNLQYTGSLIFGTRFALNSVYAFTDSEIRTVTYSAAAAIAGWTGFGVPVVKTVLVLSLALAESVRDMQELLDGEAVPVYKNSSTWTMKPSGIINALVNESGELAAAAADKAGKKVNDIFERINESAEGGIDDLTETVNGYVDEFSEEAIAAAENTINNVIFACALDILENADEVMSEDKIKELLISRLEEVSVPEKGISSVVMKEFIRLAEESAGEIAGIICGGYSSLSGVSKEKINNAAAEVCKKAEEIIGSLRDSVKESIKEITEAVKENASEGISGAGEMASEYAQDLVGNMITGASDAVSEGLNGTVQLTDKKSVSPSSALTLTYQEYLRIFLMLNSVSETKERAMLTRIALLIDINMNSGMKKAVVNGKTLVSKKEFDIFRTPVMITADAEVSVDTWLLSALVPCSTSEENDSLLNGRKKIISVRSVLSY